ncbi:MAG: adenylate kinase [Candidatus Lokiarchaeota archaeon]|nr:adenylate kinase [Candidatus Lokiarchaeota archaeon]
MKKLKLILFGPPGAGKGTFSGQIKKILPDIAHISTGDIFRENLKNETPLGLKAKSYMDKGELVPDDVTIEMVRDRLSREDVEKSGFLLDGFPRNMSQAKALSEMTQVDFLLLLEVSRDIITKRILGRFSCGECNEIYNKYTLPPKEKIEENKWVCDKCGAEIEFKQRSDDTEDTLKNRLDTYEKNAKPVIKYYKKKGKLKKVDATATLKYTEDDIKKIIEF